ncbi:hypothetical protein EIP91_009280 [Steccherinum ochraceum]|uniref:J domain-containing protein n=1 Tax=Steccherinum ochraceum TaxID=92696 RepID=A0A4V2MV42_9APHY|nr:hypothetical protein EIP91_009280 [Steccherinum ochraceum]
MRLNVITSAARPPRFALAVAAARRNLLSPSHHHQAIYISRPTGHSVHCANASTSSSSANPYPYPTQAHPTPHQIFHLPANASLQDVKARYYDLVRIYHPDSPINRASALPPTLVHARFQSISTAYDVLRGRARLSPSQPIETARRDHDLGAAMWKARQRKRAELAYGEGVVSDKWKDRMMLGAILCTVGAFIAQTISTRRQASAASVREYAQVRADYFSPRPPISPPPPSASRSADSLALDGDKAASGGRPP